MEKHTFMLASVLLLIASGLASTQDPNLAASNISFTRNAFETHHWVANVLIRGPETIQYTFDAYPDVRRIKLPNGTAFAQKKNKAWMVSQDWGKTGTKVDGATAIRLNTLASVPAGPLQDPTSRDASQGGFVWRPVSSNTQGNAQMFTFELSRENQRPDGVYPKFTFVKFSGDPDGKLLLREFEGQFGVFGAISAVNISYDILIPVNAPIIDGTSKKSAK